MTNIEEQYAELVKDTEGNLAEIWHTFLVPMKPAPFIQINFSIPADDVKIKINKPTIPYMV